MNSSLAEAIDSSGLLRSAPAVSSAELSIKIARRWGAPKKLDGPPPHHPHSQLALAHPVVSR